MKIAFTTSGKSLDAPMDSRFARAPWVLVYDLETLTFNLLENEANRKSDESAGVKTAKMIVQSGAGVVVTGHCGPSAFRILTIAGVRVSRTSAITVAKALDLYSSGSLAEIETPDMSGHWV